MFLHGWEIANHDHIQRGCDVNISTRLRRPIHGLSKRFEKKTGASGLVTLDESAKKEKNSSWRLLASWFTYFLPGLCLAQGDKRTSRFFQMIDGKGRMISIPQPLRTDAEIVLPLAIFISCPALEIFLSGTVPAFPD